MNADQTSVVAAIIRDIIDQSNFQIIMPSVIPPVQIYHPEIIPIRIINNISPIVAVPVITSPQDDNIIQGFFPSRKYGYPYTFRKPEGNVVSIIEKFPKARRNKLIKSITGTNDINVLLRQRIWTVPINADGTKLLVKLFLAFPNWKGWSLTSRIPVSMEGIYSLGLQELADLGLRFRPKIRINRYSSKIKKFKRIVAKMVDVGLIIKSETELICHELFESLNLTRGEILKMLLPFSGVKKLTRIRYPL